MDLFNVVRLAKPTQVTVGVRPLREGEIPILEATAGRILEHAQEEPADVAQPLLNATPVQLFLRRKCQPLSLRTLSSLKVLGSSRSTLILKRRVRG